MNARKPTNNQLDSLLNADGFMQNPQQWTLDIALAIAHREGLSVLTGEHWAVIKELRDHYWQFEGAVPAFSHICREHHLGRHCIERLFHGEREAWRIAGLPDPGEEARAYMHGMD